MKTITLTRLVATIGAISQVVYGDANGTTTAAIQWGVTPLYTAPVAPALVPMSALPTFQELELFSKWTPAEVSQSTDFYLHSPLSPRNKKNTKYTYDERPKVTNFTCIDIN
ncbi:hypothetical protein ACHHYP_07722 [Achlya hypogyna]|uniref:Secreted protein n=1 Tax=Achlya hypogyna TaxID=1202772 RepID=A0A0A7CNT2_ACHHY|nr:secreted protein [Achlya hypogyna]OQR87994.1 hypothetical protein ACHHYP_07722 [Achlya hypogyna]